MTERSGRRHRRCVAGGVASILMLVSCGPGDSSTSAPTVVTPTPPTIGATVPPTTVTTTPPTIVTTVPNESSDLFEPIDATSTSSTPTTISTTTPTTPTSTTTSTTTVPPAPPAPPPADPAYGSTVAAFDALATANQAGSISIVRGGEVVLERAVGLTVDRSPATASTPAVVASVSKIMLAATVARLDQRAALDVDALMPWTDLGLTPHPGWDGTTVRQLLDHSAGMPVIRTEWFKGGLTCRDFLPSVIGSPPTSERGSWRYSNGNYCALGLLVEQVTGTTTAEALNAEFFGPLGLVGARSTDDGLLPIDMFHNKPVSRLSRLGAAGTFIVSSNDLALAFGTLTPADLEVLRQPTVFIDQYGFGHTGTIDGSKACTWVLEDGLTAMSAVIAGNSISSGGNVCDRLLPALARDLGLPVVEPDRFP